MQGKVSSSFILDLIRPQTEVSRHFFSMLHPVEIALLLRLSSETYQSIKANVGLFNRLFYWRRLQIEKSVYFDFQIDGVDSEQHLKDILERIATDTLNFSLEIRTLGLLEDQFVKNLKGYIDGPEVLNHLENVRAFMREPELPMPGLQKENLGEHCNTSIQMLMVAEAVEDKIQPFDEEFCDLRKQVLENADQIMSFFKCRENHSLLKKLRYTPELINEYSPSNLCFVNILQLLILILTVYINSIKKLLKGCEEAWPSNKLFTEFCLRYSVFRNTVYALQEKYGFLFKHFHEAFSQQFREYPSMPSFSFWRVALKIWSKTMSEFHVSNRKTLSEILLIELQSVAQTTVCEYISNPQSPNNSSTECQFRKSDSLSCEDLLNMAAEQRQSLYSTYQQYLIDISANQFNIHWCGSTEQRLQGPYSKAQQELLACTSKFWQYIRSTFSSPIVLKKIAMEAMDMLAQKLKPTTFVKIEAQMNSCLEVIKERILASDNQAFKDVVSSWKKQKTNTTKTDGWIQYLAEQRGLQQQSGQKYRMYFDTNETVDIQQLERHIKQLSREIEEEKVEVVVEEAKIFIHKDDNREGKSSFGCLEMKMGADSARFDDL